jgi:hypothetical protein
MRSYHVDLLLIFGSLVLIFLISAALFMAFSSDNCS